MDRRTFLAGLASFACLSVAGQAKDSPPAEIDRLIKQLGSPKFREREAASRALEKIGEAAMPALRKAAEGCRCSYLISWDRRPRECKPDSAPRSGPGFPRRTGMRFGRCDAW